MRRLASAFLRDERGATAAELAMVFLPFVVLMFSGVEFARLAWTRQALQATATAGARCMGVLANSCAASGAYSLTSTRTYLASKAHGYGINLTSPQMTLSRTATCAGVANFSSVTLTYTFETAAPTLIEALAGGTTLTATACFPNNA